MLRNVLIVLLVGLGVLILADGVRHAQSRPTPVAASIVAPRTAAPPPAAPVAAQCCATPAAPAPRAPAEPGALAPPAATPALDMYARLAVRRRLAREGSHVYLDSLFPHTDSTLTRWFERTAVVVEMVPDTMLARWSPVLLEEVRAGMRAWNALGVSPTLREATPGEAVDLTIHWADIVSDSDRVGSTTLNWSRDGIVHGGTITLALRRGIDSLVLSPALRARVAIHELGHALGLPHSDSPDDIMFRSSPVSAPSSRDEATLRLLYVLFPGPLRVQL